MTKKIVAAIMVLFLSSCSAGVKRKEWIQGTGSGYNVKSRVQVVRDKYGVPHIRAGNNSDLFFGLGYAMAQDRFFQMDLVRRAGRGELCQLFGRIKFTVPGVAGIDFLNGDKILRALNYKGRAEQGYKNMPDEARVLLDSFTAGVNRYLSDAGATIPVYHFFRTAPVRWRPEDSLVCADVYSLSMTYGQFGTEYYYTRFLRELSAEKAQYLLPVYPADAPVVVKDLPVARADGMENLLAMLGLALNFGKG